MKQVRIGIIGCGRIARTKHINQLKSVENASVTALCDTDAVSMAELAEQLGVERDHCFTDYRALVDCPEVDAVEICSPNHLHVPMAEYAIRAGKAVNVEKPLSTDLASAESLLPLLQKHPVVNMMCFSYRFFPAVRYAKYLLEKKSIGDIISVHVEYLKSSALWPDRRLEWRFQKEYAGTGVMGDLGVHLIDMAQLLVGDIRSVCCDAAPVVKSRKLPHSEEMAVVETDDYCNFLARFEGGAVGTFVITRCALGHQNTIRYDILGTDGALSFNLNNPNVLGVCLGLTDGRSEKIEFADVPMEFYTSQEQMFVDRICGKECSYYPSLAEGVRAQAVLEALLTSSQENRWVTL